MTLDFTLAAFAIFCRQVTTLRVLTVRDYLRVAPCPPFLILRFDVDFREPFALRLGQILAAHEIRATFYFRRHASWLRVARHTRDWGAGGTNVGYHYEALDRCRGILTRQSSLFLADITRCERATPASRRSRRMAHRGPPPDYASNLDLLRARPDLWAGHGCAATRSPALTSRV